MNFYKYYKNMKFKTSFQYFSVRGMQIYKIVQGCCVTIAIDYIMTSNEAVVVEISSFYART